jgi:hypothetical protein
MVFSAGRKNFPTSARDESSTIGVSVVSIFSSGSFFKAANSAFIFFEDFLADLFLHLVNRCQSTEIKWLSVLPASFASLLMGTPVPAVHRRGVSVGARVKVHQLLPERINAAGGEIGSKGTPWFEKDNPKSAAVRR